MLKRIVLRYTLVLGLGPLALGALALAACGASKGPEWTSLALQSEPAPPSLDGPDFRTTDGTRCRIVVREGQAMLEVELEPRHWSGAAPGVWRAPLGATARAKGGHLLAAGARRFQESTAGAEGLAENSFSVQRRELWLRLPAGEELPQHTSLFLRLRDSERAAPGRVRGRRYSGAGFSVLPGMPVQRRCAIPAASALSFSVVVDSLVFGTRTLTPEVVFRVALDGETVFEQRVADPGRPGQSRHRILLPAGARSAALLEFSVTGTPAFTAFLDPLLGPAEIGSPGERPWGSRPDIVVFLADTFRADSMALHGGTLGLTPNLDRFAGEGLAFSHAWSTGTFTLSAHATMFTGLYPHQAGILGEANALPEELETLAEFLHARGYRTGAITDSGIVSQAFALDQGFAVFDEGRRELEQAVEDASAFLDADDGRPVFLFLQTYRVHRPFRVSVETRREHGARLGIEGEFNALEEELVALARAAGHAQVGRAHDAPPEVLATPAGREILRKLQAHYQGCVIDLDRAFESLRGDLERRGLLRHGNLIFTSDHGEAFGEHDQLYHKDDVFEEQTRIPMIVAGRGITPDTVDFPASLIDLAPTVAALAGFPREERWVGRSLLGLSSQRVLFSFECGGNTATSTFAVRDGTRKVIGFEQPESIREGRVLGAFDLATDPAERSDLWGEEVWPREQLARFANLAQHLLEPLGAARSADLDPEKRGELDDMGYGGEE